MPSLPCWVFFKKFLFRCCTIHDLLQDIIHDCLSKLKYSHMFSVLTATFLHFLLLSHTWMEEVVANEFSFNLGPMIEWVYKDTLEKKKKLMEKLNEKVSLGAGAWQTQMLNEESGDMGAWMLAFRAPKKLAGVLARAPWEWTSSTQPQWQNSRERPHGYPQDIPMWPCLVFRTQ